MLFFPREHWNGVVLKAPSMQEKSGQTLRWLALAISAQAVNQSCTHAKKTEIGDNPAFTFRTFLLRLGLIGDEYKNVRKHLLANLDGDKAWRYDKSTYACLQKPGRTEDAR